MDKNEDKKQRKQLLRFCADAISSSFQPIYYRNNRRGGHKNLRCFPHCNLHNAKPQHNPHGYCGSGIRIHLNSTTPLQLFGFFELDTSSSVVVGEMLTNPILRSRTRTVEQPLLPYMKADLISSDAHGCVYELNGKRESWHYGWPGFSNTKSKHFHQLKVLALLPMDGAMMQVVDILYSDSFQVMSTRRKEIMLRQQLQRKKDSMCMINTLKKELDRVNVSDGNQDDDVKKELVTSPASSSSMISSNSSIAKKRKNDEPQPEAEMDSAERDLKEAQIARNLGILWKMFPHLNFITKASTSPPPPSYAKKKQDNSFVLVEFFNFSTQRHCLLEKLRLFMSENCRVVTKEPLLRRAYGDLIVLLESEINLFLQQYFQLSIPALLEQVNNLEEVDYSLSFPFDQHHQQNLKPSWFYISFVSQMSLVLRMFNSTQGPIMMKDMLTNYQKEKSRQPVINQPLEYIKEDNGYHFHFKGSYDCDLSRSTFFTEEKPEACQHDSVIQNVIELGFKKFAVEYDGRILKVRSDKTLLPDAYESYTLDNVANFSYASFMGLSNTFFNKVGYIGRHYLKFCPIVNKHLWMPSLEIYYYFPESDKPTVKRLRTIYEWYPASAAVIRNSTKIAHASDICIDVRCQINDAPEEKLTKSALQDLTTSGKINFPANWQTSWTGLMYLTLTQPQQHVV